MTEPDFSQGVAFVRGRYVPVADAAIPIDRLGLPALRRHVRRGHGLERRFFFRL